MNAKYLFAAAGTLVVGIGGWFGGTKKGRSQVNGTYKATKNGITNFLKSTEETALDGWKKFKGFKLFHIFDKKSKEVVDEKTETEKLSEQVASLVADLDAIKLQHENLQTTHQNLSTQWNSKVKEFNIVKEDNVNMASELKNQSEMLKAFETTADENEAEIKKLKKELKTSEALVVKLKKIAKQDA